MRSDIPVDQFRAEFDREIGQITAGIDSATNAVTRFKEDNGFARFTEIVGGCNPGHACAEDYRGHKTPAPIGVRLIEVLSTVARLLNRVQ